MKNNLCDAEHMRDAVCVPPLTVIPSHFVKQAIRAFYVLGFVPWHVRRLASTGDLVPEVIPLGTFTWSVELRKEKERRREREMNNEKMRISYVPNIVDETRKGKDWKNQPPADNAIPKNKSATDDDKSKFDSDGRPKEATGRGKSKVEIGNPVGARNVRADGETKYVHYKVHMKDGGLLDEEVYVYDFVPAKFDICTNSMLYATVVSPLSHLIVDYKNLRQAQIRRSHADAWNTQSHLITTFKPGMIGAHHVIHVCARSTVTSPFLSFSAALWRAGSAGNSVPEWKGFNYGMHDLSTRVPNADGNPLSFLFDTNGESEVQGRDSIIKRNVGQVCSQEN